VKAREQILVALFSTPAPPASSFSPHLKAQEKPRRLARHSESSGGAPLFAGAATPHGLTWRPCSGRNTGCGFHLGGATLPAGTYNLVVFARSSVVTAFNNSAVVRITVRSRQPRPALVGPRPGVEHRTTEKPESL
jgi:hypothetical protein